MCGIATWTTTSKRELTMRKWLPDDRSCLGPLPRRATSGVRLDLVDTQPGSGRCWPGGSSGRWLDGEQPHDLSTNMLDQAGIVVRFRQQQRSLKRGQPEMFRAGIKVRCRRAPHTAAAFQSCVSPRSDGVVPDRERITTVSVLAPPGK